MVRTSLQMHHCIAVKRKVPVLVAPAEGYGRNTPETSGGVCGTRTLSSHVPFVS